uniref:HNH endonuclease n=1 Tax=viral metagenome TaxID=1070528 RepID=A0A6C0JSD9_9ZZZZ
MDNLQYARRILNKILKQSLIEHIDGNTLNDCADNLRWATFSEWLAEPTKKIDWDLYVNRKEAEFVRLNVSNFQVLMNNR